MEKLNKKIIDELIVGRVVPHIYAFSTNTIPSYVKVGDTYRPIDIRLKEWEHYFSYPKCLFTEKAIVNNDIFFRDYAVHRYLEKDLHKQRLKRKDLPSGVYYSQEFFKDITAKQLSEAIADIKRDFENKTQKYSFYNMSDRQQTEERYERENGWKLRGNQEKVVENFQSAKDKGYTDLLMYAVMRFGKSFTALHCAKQMKAKSVVVVSAKADVKEEWKKTVQKATGFDNYEFVTALDLHRDKKLLSKLINNQKVPVVFLTLEDLQGPLIKEKHKEVFSTQFDLLIIDETHFGARAEKFGEVLREKPSSKEINKQDREEFVDTEQAESTITKYINADIKLHLSGTPYRILMGSEFEPDQIIAFCQFTDIIDAKEKEAKKLLKEDKDEWENPYYGFPQMVRFAFNPNESAQHKIEEFKKAGKTVAMSELFRPKATYKTSDNLHKQFINEKEVLDLLKIIDGSKEDPNILGFLDYEKIRQGNMCRHIVIVLPYCASCDALEHLLLSQQYKFKNLKDYQIINISGIDRTNLYKETIDVKRTIAENEKKNQKTITLTVNRMLTGSTVEQWDTMIYLKDTASPQEYDQAIFRLQNPYIRTYKNSEGKIIKYDMKPQTLLVDFHPNRMFRMQELKAQCYNANTDKAGNSKLEARIKKELEISPILFINKNKVDRVTPTDIMNAVSEYSRNRGVLEETNEIPVDLSILEKCKDLRLVIETENELGDKGGLSFKANDGDGRDYEGEAPTDDNNSSKTNNRQIKNQDDEENSLSLEKRFRTYYSRILFFAFLSSDQVKSLEEIISIIDKGENVRIAKNLGLNKHILELLQENINRFALSKLDYKIQNISKLSTDEQATPLERALVAIQKFGRLGESEVVTPLSICRTMVDLIPHRTLLNAVERGHKILDIASKTGEFTIALYEKIRKLGLDTKKFQNTIYAIPTSSVTYEFTRKIYEILGLNLSSIAQHFNSYDLLQKGMDSVKVKAILTQNKPFNAISMQDAPKGGNDMIKFEAIVGNPPYQEIISSQEGNKSLGKQLFPAFIINATHLTDRFVALITPARWFTSDAQDSSFIALRKYAKENNHFHTLCVLNNNKSLFPDVELSSLTYFLYDKKYTGNTTFIDGTTGKNLVSQRPLFEEGLDIIIPLDNTLHIMKKVKKTPHFQTFMEITCGRNAFGIVGKRDVLEKLTTTKYKTGYVKVYCAHEEIRYTSPKNITKNKGLMGKWKVFTSKGNGGAGLLTDNRQVAILGKAFVGEPNSVCSDSLIPIGNFNIKTEAINLRKYLSTKFLRYMVGILKVSQNIYQNVYYLVPLQDFTNKSDIDWSKPIAEIDKQLYKKYGLTPREIDSIESMIKPME